MTYTEMRSKHALRIDRALNARARFSTFTKQYASAPNRNDVEDYDTRKGTIIPPPTPKPSPEPRERPKEPQKVGEVAKDEYVPSSKEKGALLPYFHKLSPIEQHKDLLTTKNVIRKKEDVHKWKENPKYYDIRDIDTQPKELIQGRLDVVQRAAGNIQIVPESAMNKIRRSPRALGAFMWNPWDSSDKGKIVYRPKRIAKADPQFSMNKVFAHELGHAYDKNAAGDIARMTGNINLGYEIPSSIKNLGFGKMNNIMLDLHGKSYERVYKPVEKVTREKIFPYKLGLVPRGHHEYRTRKEELFANWFTGFITEKPLVKRESRQFYNIFKKKHKGLFKAIRQSDIMVTSKYMKGVLV